MCYIGRGIDAFNELPTKLCILKYVCPLLFEQKLKKRQATIITAQAVQNIWNENGRQTCLVYKIANKIGNLIDTYNSHRYKEACTKVRVVQKRQNFLEELHELFDVSKHVVNRLNHNEHVDGPNELAPIAAEPIDINLIEPELIAVDPVALAAGRNDNIDADIQVEHEQHAYNLRRKRNADINIEQIRMELEEEAEEENYYENEIENVQNFGKIYPSARVCSMLDRSGLSNRLASLAFLTILTENGVDPRRIVCSETTMFQHRKQNRQREAKEIKENFCPDGFNTVHFDGKTYIGKGQVTEKRLAVVLSKKNATKVLGVENVNDGKAETVAEQIFETLLKWGIENVRVVCFDTEAVNSGRLNGVVIRLQRLMNKMLCPFACRHHIYEVFLGAAFDASVEFGVKSESPKIIIFENFAAQYSKPEFDKDDYSTVHDDRNFEAALGADKINDLVTFCRNILPKLTNSRNEYSELAKLVIILLSRKDDCELKINKPGAYTRARFMNRIIYSIKIYLYRNQIDLCPNDLKNIREFLLFSLKAYLKFWFETPIVSLAPNNDILFIKEVLALEPVIPQIVQEVLGKIINHLWYLSSINVALAFFDQNVSNKTKREMIKKLNVPVLSNPTHNPLRLIVADQNELKNISLAKLSTSKTKTFFEITGINCDFLDLDPKYWKDNEQFQNAQKEVNNLVCVNDPAERAIALYQRCKDHIIKDTGRSDLVQVVEKSQKVYKKLRRTDILDALFPDSSDEEDAVELE